MKSDEEIMETLIVGGLVGAALGALISKDKEEGATLGALAGAVLVATFKANEKALQTNVPMYFEENGNLYRTEPGGAKKWVRKIDKPPARLPKNFKLR